MECGVLHTPLSFLIDGTSEGDDRGFVYFDVAVSGFLHLRIVGAVRDSEDDRILVARSLDGLAVEADELVAGLDLGTLLRQAAEALAPPILTVSRPMWMRISAPLSRRRPIA